MENGITKKQSAVLQGIAIWMMVYHHLYLGTNAYESLLPFINADVARGIAWFCKLCVGIFAFVSGYGMYYVMNRHPAERFFGRLIEEYRHVLVRILRLYGKLWLVVLVFVGIHFGMLGREFVAEELWGNLTAFQPTYNGAWWYVEQYAKMLLALPLLDLLLTGFPSSEEKKKRVFFLTLAGVVLAGILCSPLLYEFAWKAVKAMRPSFFLIFIAGYFIARCRIYQRIDKALRRRGGWLPTCLSVVLIGVVTAVRVLLATDAAWAELDFLLVPVLVYGVLVLLSYIKSFGVFLAWWGKQSTYIWLTHVFLIGLCQPVRYFVRLDILVYLAVMLASAAAAMLLRGVEAGARRAFCCCLEKNMEKFEIESDAAKQPEGKRKW